MSFVEFLNKSLRHIKGYCYKTRYAVLFAISKIVPDEVYLKHRYKRLVGKPLNLDCPMTYNEKLNWMKLYDRNPLYTKLADKYEVREYVKGKIGERYLVPLLGVWNNAEEIDFAGLPKQFVLKCTHDSGSYIVCKNKACFDRNEAKKRLKKALRINYYYYSREWAYKDIKPRVIAEQYLEDINDKEARDYKFFAFDGEPRFFYIATDRSIGRTKFDFYDMDFQHLDVRQDHPNSEKKLHKPTNFDLMVKLVRCLAEGIRQVRIDFYEINGRVYFSEYTFYNNGGVTPFDPEEWDLIFGKWMKL